ncbi:MAG: tetratricopeptide repeat protein [Bacteroidota bacterium]
MVQKIFHCIWLFLPLNLFSIDNGNPDSLFSVANELYQEEKYEEAIDTYLKIIQEEYESAALYYNLGNAYFHSNKLGKARLFYERAHLLEPSDEDVKANLEHVQSLLTDRFEAVPELFIKRWLNSLIHSFSSNTWLILCLIFFSLFLISASGYIFLSSLRMKKLGFYSGILLFFLSLISFVFATKQYYHQRDPGSAIVMDGSLVVKSAPRQSGKDLFVLHEGTKVWKENEVGEWTEIRISDGRQGWVRVSSIEEV